MAATWYDAFYLPHDRSQKGEPDGLKPLSAGEHARFWFGSARTVSAAPSASLPVTTSEDR